jgi:hypothetical protein
MKWYLATNAFSPINLLCYKIVSVYLATTSNVEPLSVTSGQALEHRHVEKTNHKNQEPNKLEAKNQKSVR